MAMAIASEEPFTRKVVSVSQELLDACDIIARDAVIRYIRRACNQHQPGRKRLGVPVVP